MPGPILKPQPLPEWMDPQMESVTSPLWKQLTRRAVGLSGLDTPEGQIMQAAAPTVTPLVSIFKDMETGVPSKVLRSAYTERFKQAAKKLGTNFSEAADAFAQRFPRVAAHMNPKAVPNKPSQYLSGAIPKAYTRTEDLTKGIPATIGVTENGLKLITDPLTGHVEANKTLLHEGTHVAQRLGNKDFGPLYKNAHDITGYNQNPFERNARYGSGENVDLTGLAGWRFLKDKITLKLKDLGIPYQPEILRNIENLPEDLQKDILKLQNGYEQFRGSRPPNVITQLNLLKEREFLSQSKPAKTILEILQDRAARGWTPSK